jgi:hypothetical protein
MTEELIEDGPTIEEAKAVAATLSPELQPDAADLPGDVRDGEITDEEGAQ